MKNNIQNLSELQKEIKRLKFTCEAQEVALKKDVSTYVGQFRLSNIFKKYLFSTTESGKTVNFGTQILTFVLPYLLNKTIFRNSGLAIKTLSILLSGKLANLLTPENMVHIFEFGQRLFNKKKQNTSPC